MKIVSWNVNGLKRLRPLNQLFKRLDADIICFQEVRSSGLSDSDLESLAFVNGYNSYFSFCTTRRGYSGVATFCKETTATPINATDDFSITCCNSNTPEFSSEPGEDLEQVTINQLKEEGRFIITEHDHFVLINIYAPAVSVEGREVFKMVFLKALRRKIDSLITAGKKVIVVGDFNICPSVSDRAGPILYSSEAEWEQSPSRRWLHRLLHEKGPGLVDSFRELHPNMNNAYTCWSERSRARETNYGVRIDLILVDRMLFQKYVTAAGIHSEIMGSDHCPTSLILNLSIGDTIIQRKPPTLCAQYLPRFVKRQSTITAIFSQRLSTSNDTKGNSLVAKNNKYSQLRDSELREVASSKKKQVAYAGNSSNRERSTQLTIMSYFGRNENKQHTAQENRGKRKRSQVMATEIAATQVSTDNNVSNVEELDHIKRRKRVANAWKNLLSGPPPPPFCKHGKPTVRKTVLKAGKNKGKAFFSCSLPEGIGKNTRCNFFKWA